MSMKYLTSSEYNSNKHNQDRDVDSVSINVPEGHPGTQNNNTQSHTYSCGYYHGNEIVPLMLLKDGDNGYVGPESTAEEVL